MAKLTQSILRRHFGPLLMAVVFVAFSSFADVAQAQRSDQEELDRQRAAQQKEFQRQKEQQQVTQSSNAFSVPVEQRFKVTPKSIEILEKQLPPEPDGVLAYEVLKAVCEIGPRISGTKGMQIQQQMLKSHFEALGATVYEQPFNVKHPVRGDNVELKNMIARWHPERKFRLLIACHYDTRPFADRDTKNPRGVFLGANDGASGVGLLCELGRYMKDLDSDFGIDFVFFDGEEFVYQAKRDPLFLGSTYFARQYKANPPPVLYSGGVLVDMIGDKDLTLYREKNSYKYARTITNQIWAVAEDMQVKEFIARNRYELRDDHLPLIQIAGIPTCDIIDFDYPVGRKNAYWHTTEDTPDKCSAKSLATVGKVLLAWLKIVRSER